MVVHGNADERGEAMDDARFILVCDDNKAIADSLVFFLQKAGYRAQAVNSALDCVAVARRNHPDLILMDIMMPGMDGATASGLMKDVPEIDVVPILLLSAMSEEQVAAKMEDAGAAGYLLKPYRKELLLEAVEHCLSTPEPWRVAS